MSGAVTLKQPWKFAPNGIDTTEYPAGHVFPAGSRGAALALELGIGTRDAAAAVDEEAEPLAEVLARADVKDFFWPILEDWQLVLVSYFQTLNRQRAEAALPALALDRAKLQKSGKGKLLKAMQEAKPEDLAAILEPFCHEPAPPAATAQEQQSGWGAGGEGALV